MYAYLDMNDEGSALIVALMIGTVNWILSEILRGSSCRYNSVGHFIFSGCVMCGHNVTLDVHIEEVVVPETQTLLHREPNM